MNRRRGEKSGGGRQVRSEGDSVPRAPGLVRVEPVEVPGNDRHRHRERQHAGDGGGGGSRDPLQWAVGRTHARR